MPKKAQSNLHSFFTKKKSSVGLQSANAATTTTLSKESRPIHSTPEKDEDVTLSHSKDDDKRMEKDGCDTVLVSSLEDSLPLDDENSSKRKSALMELRKKKRRIIDDDDDDGDDNEAPPLSVATPDSEVSKGVKEADTTLEDASKKEKYPTPSKPATVPKAGTAATPASGASSSKTKPALSAKTAASDQSAAFANVPEQNPLDKSPSTKDRQFRNSALAKALKVKSDQELYDDAKASWAEPALETAQHLPYSILCDTWSKIEAISSRLQIQELLTELFRQCLIVHVDLLPILYLCSNAVAPAYECVELGIGDAILVRAISEATGASTTAIKSQYEAQGDLGLVAQNAKGSQKTLGGFFKQTKKEKVLSTHDVLQVFQQIATTKGNQAQKWKVDSIKKLLVRAASKEETRYIIRGLQGKLRIGLAQSTVLISLAHALALSPPKSVSSSDLSTGK